MEINSCENKLGYSKCNGETSQGTNEKAIK